MSEEEISEKLKLLKHYSREFTLWEARWKAYGGKREAFNAMMDAERSYVALSDWLWSQGFRVWWDREKGEFVVHNDKVLANRLSQ